MPHKRLVEYWSETTGTVTLHDLAGGKRVSGIDANSATRGAAGAFGFPEGEIHLVRRPSPRKRMRVAILGWGSLVWKPGSLRLLDNAWHPDGPLLPIEFARISRRNRLTLVLHEASQRNVRTLWAESEFRRFDPARKNLQDREECSLQSVGYVTADSSRVSSLSNDLIERILNWGVVQGFDAVIWTELFSNFQEKENVPLTPPNALAYLRRIKQNGAAEAAEEYVRRAPAQVRTEIREHIETELGWLPPSVEPTSVTSAIKTSDDLRIKEWEQCRATIGRLDTILADLRKYGFSLITGLLTASAFLAFLGVQTTASLSPPPTEARAAPFIAIMVLIAALSSVDSYYQVLLSAGVERALDLEVKTDPHIRVTKYLSVNAMHTRSTYVTLFLYLLLLATAAALGILATGGLGLKLWTSGPLSLPQLAISAIRSWGGLIWLALGAVAACVLFYKLPRKKEKPKWRGLAIVGAITLWFTLGLGVSMLAWAASNRPSVPAVSWVVALAALLAIYVELYWLWVALKSGLYRGKERGWPEGEAKSA